MPFTPVAWPSQSVVQRNHVLAWTSLWIFVPFFVWLGCHVIGLPPGSSAFYAYPLVVSGVASISHWTDNVTGDWKHRADLGCATFLLCIFTFRLLSTGQTGTAAALSSGLIVCFFLQRYTQTIRPVNWGKVLVYHSLFRYLAFWLSMSVHLPDVLTTASLLPGIVVVLTMFYVLHIKWLMQRKQN